MITNGHAAQHEVLEAHRSAGWHFVEDKVAQDSRNSEWNCRSPADRLPCKVIAPMEVPQGQFRGRLKDQAHAFGLTPCLYACALWGVAGCHPTGTVGLLMWQLMGTLSAARLCVAVLQSAAWASAAVQALIGSLHGLQEAMASHKGPWLNKKGKLKQDAFSLLNSIRAALHSCRGPRRLVSGNADSAALSAERVVCMCADLDTAYYALLEHHLSCGYETPPVPPPHVYFLALARAHTGNAAAVKGLVRQPAGCHGKTLLRKVWGIRKAVGGLELPEQAAPENPLLAVMWARFQESCRLFYSSGLALAGGLDRVAAEEEARIRAVIGSKPAQGRPISQTKRRKVDSPSSSESDASTMERSDSDSGSDSASSGSDVPEQAKAWQGSAFASKGYPGPALAVWPADSALSRWRAASRECHLYAYAPPTREALEVLAGVGPILEMGAGTGYWALQLRQAGVQVIAVDSHPPGAKSGNLWHKGIPAMSEVVRGGVETVAAASPSHALFLCYPPSDSAMASECLQAFRGRTVCFVGEWHGDTGDPAFMHELQSGFRLKQRIALPNWSDTAHELTIWQRRGPGVRSAAPLGTHAPAEEQLGRKLGPAIAHDPAAVVCSCCGRSKGSQRGTSIEHSVMGAQDCAGKAVGARETSHVKLLRRCCYCRQAVYCSVACFEADRARHNEMHALRMLFFGEREISFWNAVDFEHLRP